jgi:prepilin-type N-terminal cleavage/methylation domain-containing protein
MHTGALRSGILELNPEVIAMPASRHNGFTLVELLVVIAIIGILASLLLPVVGAIRSQANTVDCQAKLRTMTLALTGYAVDNRGMVIPAQQWRVKTDGSGQEPVGWYVTIAPYLESTSEWATQDLSLIHI